jgi:hypothetical protein
VTAIVAWLPFKNNPDMIAMFILLATIVSVLASQVFSRKAAIAIATALLLLTTASLFFPYTLQSWSNGISGRDKEAGMPIRIDQSMTCVGFKNSEYKFFGDKGESFIYYFDNYLTHETEAYKLTSKNKTHPQTGEKLLPVSKNTYYELQKQVCAREERQKKEAEEATRKAQEAAEDSQRKAEQSSQRPDAKREVIAKTQPLSVNKEKNTGDKGRQAQQLAMVLSPQIDEKEKRLQEFKSLINDHVNVQRGKSNVALVIEAKNTGGVSPESLLHNRLKAENANIIDNLFKKALFKSRGFFEEIYDGNTELLRQTDVLSKLDKLILGKLNYSYQRGAAVDKDLVSCDIRFSYKVFNSNGDAVRSDSINTVGPGFSEDAALERGLEILIEKYSDRILQN